MSVTGATLSEALADLDEQFPGIGARVLDDEGRLRRFVNVYVNDDDVRFLEDLADAHPGRFEHLDHPGRRRGLSTRVEQGEFATLPTRNRAWCAARDSNPEPAD